MKTYINIEMSRKRMKKRIFLDKAANIVFSFTILFALLVLGLLLYRVVSQSIGWLDIPFLTGKLSISAERAGIKGVLIGSVLLMAIVAPVTLFLGVATAIYMEEYSKNGVVQSLININISNLSGVPSVILNDFRIMIDKMRQVVEDEIRILVAVSEQNATSTENVSASVQEQTASISEISTASVHLNSLAQNLKKLVGSFKT